MNVKWLRLTLKPSYNKLLHCYWKREREGGGGEGGRDKRRGEKEGVGKKGMRERGGGITVTSYNNIILVFLEIMI